MTGGRVGQVAGGWLWRRSLPVITAEAARGVGAVALLVGVSLSRGTGHRKVYRSTWWAGWELEAKERS